MDTSPEYIKMWLASGLEIEGDIFGPYVCPGCYSVTNDDGLYCNHQCPITGPGCGPRKPLPRQDQLHKMLPVPLEQEAYGLYFFNSKQWRLYTSKGNFTGDTAEKVLIQCAMHELHDKKWDGEKWR